MLRHCKGKEVVSVATECRDKMGNDIGVMKGTLQLLVQYPKSYHHIPTARQRSLLQANRLLPSQQVHSKQGGQLARRGQ